MKTVRALRIKHTAPWLARLALFALLFQMSAIDHHSHPADVTGIAGTSSHEMHCHGALGSCANGGGEMPAATAQPPEMPSAPPVLQFAIALDVAAPASLTLSPENQPPRS